jgi:hypothetical protein
MGGYKEQLVWKLHVKSAPLRAVCGLAGRIILLEGLDRAVGECARDGCDNIFLDRDSRGKRRIYCRDAKCQAALNAAGARANRDFKKLPPKVQADYKRLKREDPSLTQEKYVSQYSQSIKTGTKVKIADTKRTRK